MGRISVSASETPLDRIAHTYHTSGDVPDIHIENICQDHFVTWLSSKVVPGTRVLELGYGDGIVTAGLSSLNVDLTVVDGASTLVELAHARHPRATCVHSYFEAYSPVERFDLVVASHVLEHVDDPRGVLASIRGWLKPSGQVIAVVPNSQSLHRQLAVLMGLQPALDTLSPRDHMVGHQRVYSLEELRSDFESMGYLIREERGFFLKVVPNSMMLDYSRSLLDALNVISSSLPAALLANLVVVATPSV
jgi:2-polyprenyl-3-methyl-5-hydroxy-6-metoxy-1,4-benzoquinol methylase